jgi:signal transduction histidine kinase
MSAPPLGRPRVWGPLAGDVGLATVAVVLTVALLVDGDPAPGFRRPDLVTWVLTLLAAVSVVAARRRPLAALLVTGTCGVLLTWHGDETELVPFVITGLLFTVGSRCPRRPALLGLGFVAAGLLVSAAAQPPDLGLRGVLQSLAIFAVAWAIGRLTRGRREALLALVAAAEHQAVAERDLAAAERDHAALAQVEERLRIARELHDVLAHSISVVSVQATVGEHLAATDPVAARRALQTIGEVSRSSMTELRQMLTLLRDDSGAEAGDRPPYEPAHGLADLEPLADTYRSAGLPVLTATAGTPRPLRPSTELCAYRIIQEALTNTLKHAGPSRAVVGLDYQADALLVVVSDDGRHRPAGRAGHGLVGMRERTALLGGRFEAGPVASGGFRVRATIPYAPEPVA